MNMDYLLQLTGFAVTIFMAVGGLYLGIRKDLNSQALTNQKHHHETDVRLKGIETVVSPYAKDIAELKTTQQDNMVKIAELTSLRNDLDRMERQLETLQNRKG